MINGIKRNRRTIKILFSGYNRPIKSGYNDLFNQIKKYIEDETVGKGVVETNGNTITYRSLTVKVYNNGYDISDDTVHIYHSKGNTFEEFVDDYWEWVNPF